LFFLTHGVQIALLCAGRDSGAVRPIAAGSLLKSPETIDMKSTTRSARRGSGGLLTLFLVATTLLIVLVDATPSSPSSSSSALHTVTSCAIIISNQTKSNFTTQNSSKTTKKFFTFDVLGSGYKNTDLKWSRKRIELSPEVIVQFHRLNPIDQH